MKFNKIGLLVPLLLDILNVVVQGVPCPPPAVPANARLALSNSSSLEPGTTATYTCDEGYHLFGVAVLSCSPEGRWVGELPFCAVNVAYRKPTNQSTTARGGDSSNANDGNLATLHDGKYCTETRRENSPWWRVDLLRPYEVRVIRVFPRRCCGQQPLQDLEIRVGNSTSIQKNRLCAWNPGTLDEGSTKDLSCARALVGRYVFIQLVGVEGALSLCEIQVFTTQEFSRDRCANHTDLDRVATFSQTCYEFQVNLPGANFQRAREYCQARGGDLAHRIRNVTQNFLAGELERLKSQMQTQLVWVGATKEPGASVRTWKWINNERIDRPLWGEDQPNNYNGEQNCVVLDGGRQWLWNDVGCNLDYLLWICQYYPMTCGSPEREVNTTIGSSDFSVGSSVQYFCPADSVIIGNENRTCQADGFWSGRPPTCQFIDCGVPRRIANGESTLVDNKTTFGARVEYWCHDNYTMSGPTTRTCGKDNQWDQEDPSCLYDICSPLESPVNGSLVTTGIRVGDNATYTCDPGNDMTGDSQRTCQIGGKWSGTEPKCTYIECPKPKAIENGYFVLLGNATVFGSKVKYQCSENHLLHGEEELTCNKFGQWSAKTPTCEIISCGEPEVHFGSYVTGYEFTVGAIVEYFCDPGFYMVGDHLNRTCLLNGTWSGSAPECNLVNCGRVQPIPYAILKYLNESNPTVLGAMIKYECTVAYRLVGNATRVCNKDGKWSGNTPNCEEIRCSEPVRPVNAILSVIGNDRAGEGETVKIGTIAQYRCEKGYKLEGVASRKCNASGAWNVAASKCIYVDCGSPEMLDNGKVFLLENTTYMGSTAQYSCDDLYELSGNKTRICTQDGKWSGKLPKCLKIECLPPEKPPSIYAVDVSMDGNTITAGSVAIYRCVKGQRLIGNGTRVCQHTRKWSGDAPECQWVDCGPPPDIMNGRTYNRKQATIYNSTIETYCFPGYKVVGPKVRHCQEDGKWSGEDPKCELNTTSNEILASHASSNNAPNDSEVASARATGIAVGVGAGILLLIAIGLSLLYMRMRKPKPIQSVENIEPPGNTPKESATVVGYAARPNTEELSRAVGRLNGHRS